MAALPMSRPSCACGPFQSPHPPVLAEATAQPGFAVSWSTATSGGVPTRAAGRRCQRPSWSR